MKNPAQDSSPSLMDAWQRVQAEMNKRVVGQEHLSEQLLVTLLSDGHCLVSGMPGVAKTLATQTLAQALGLVCHRVRCSADVYPEDILGEAENEPSALALLSANILLVDDLDRLPPKSSNVLQQAIQDREVSVRGQLRPLADPFMLVATRYLGDGDEPEIQREPREDRFMFEIRVRYPSYSDEYRIAETNSASITAPPEQILTVDDVIRMRRQVRCVELPTHVIHYALRLVRCTRVHEGENPDFVYEWVSQGAGPRAVHCLTMAAKVRASLHGRSVVETEDIRAVTYPTLRHRLITNRNAHSNGVTVDRVIARLLEDIPTRLDGDDAPPQPGETLSPEEWSADPMF
jgi:MoxR-like ATPase